MLLVIVGQICHRCLAVNHGFSRFIRHISSLRGCFGVWFAFIKNILNTLLCGGIYEVVICINFIIAKTRLIFPGVVDTVLYLLCVCVAHCFIVILLGLLAHTDIGQTFQDLEIFIRFICYIELPEITKEQKAQLVAIFGRDETKKAG